MWKLPNEGEEEKQSKQWEQFDQRQGGLAITQHIRGTSFVAGNRTNLQKVMPVMQKSSESDPEDDR